MIVPMLPKVCCDDSACKSTLPPPDNTRSVERLALNLRAERFQYALTSARQVEALVRATAPSSS